MTELLDQPTSSHMKHMLGHGPNTTPSLYQSLLLDMRYNSERWFPRVSFVDGGDRAS